MLLLRLICCGTACVLGTLWATAACLPSQGSASQTFARANEAYRAGQYGEAARLYENLVALKVNDAKPFYNLGNSYFRLNRLGDAIANYRRAARLAPRDENVKANLRVARSMTKDKIESAPMPLFLRKVLSWHLLLNTNESAIVFAALYLLFWGLLIRRIFVKHRVFTWVLTAGACLVVLMGSSIGYKMYRSHYVREGVVTAEEAAVHAGDGEEYTIVFKLHDGTEFMMERQRGNWTRIRLADGKRGWIRTPDITRVF